MGQYLVQLFLDLVGLGTAKVVLPVLSLGYLRALSPPSGSLGRTYCDGWAIRRLPRGRFGVGSDLATMVGLAFWIAVIVAAHQLFPRPV